MKCHKSEQSRVAETLHKDRIEPFEKLFSCRIDELVDFGVFRKYWKRLFGNERGMLIKKSLSIKPHQWASLFGEDFKRHHSVHHKGFNPVVGIGLWKYVCGDAGSVLAR